jgi:hypothetical protein
VTKTLDTFENKLKALLIEKLTRQKSKNAEIALNWNVSGARRLWDGRSKPLNLLLSFA